MSETPPEAVLKVLYLSGRRGRERELLAGRLLEGGMRPVPSEANFLLVEVGVDDLALSEALRRRGLLIRAGSEFGLPRTVRITVAPPPVMERVAAELLAARDELA